MLIKAQNSDSGENIDKYFNNQCVAADEYY